MRYAIFSDLHDNQRGLAAVLADAEQHATDHFIYLGDVGHDPILFQVLHARDILCTFGNWEVSGWQRLPTTLATWVGTWPAMIRHGEAIFCHATPDIPATATTTATAAAYMSNGVGWMTLFPRLNRNEEARWVAIAALETLNACVAFHGHTHVQEVYGWVGDEQGQRHLRAFSAPSEFTLEPGNPIAPNRYLVGVGSAGAPDDGPQLRYVIYDDATKQLLLRRL